MRSGMMTIRYALPWSATAVPVRLDLYDIRGRLVATLVNEHKTAGYFTGQWNLRREGKASGLLLVRLKAGNKHIVTSGIMVK